MPDELYGSDPAALYTVYDPTLEADPMAAPASAALSAQLDLSDLSLSSVMDSLCPSRAEGSRAHQGIL